MIRFLFVFDRAIWQAKSLNAVYLKERAGEENQ
jgi:hypothetical protein